MAQPSLYERQSAQPYKNSFQMPETYAPLSTVQGMSNKKPRVSRLELMKQNYEKKRQKDVEEKLTELRAQQTRTDSGKVRSGGTVRAFFAERRAMEASKRGQQDPSSLPPIGIHFKKMKSNQGPVVPRSSKKKENKPIIPSENVALTHDIVSTGNRGMVKYHIKKSKGIDKQNPLPPLQRRPSISNNHKPPTPNRRYETHNSLKSEDEAVVSNHLDLNVDQESIVPEKIMAHVPHPPKNRKPYKPNKRPAKPVLVHDTEERADEEDNDGWSLYSDEPQPNLSKVKALRMKRLSQQKPRIGNSKPEKPTEFQKWQMQQDEERRERLENYRKKNQPADYSDNDEKDRLSTRERELLEKIKAEQNKLSEIKRMQQELEEQEKFERESTMTPQIPNGNKRKMEAEEEETFHTQKQIHKTPTPVKKASPIPKEIPKKKEAQRDVPEAPKKSKAKPNPQIIQQEQVFDEQEPETKDNFVNFYEQAGEEAERVAIDLTPCSICGRKFASERLSKHQVFCQKNFNKKRKKFDVRKQRVAGMEHENYVLSGKFQEETPKAKKADWRVQHENFIKTIRYAKGGSDEPPPVIENPHYVACPYCERKFNPETAERHIPRCKDIKARPAPPKKDKQRRKR